VPIKKHKIKLKKEIKIYGKIRYGTGYKPAPAGEEGCFSEDITYLEPLQVDWMSIKQW